LLGKAPVPWLPDAFASIGEPVCQLLAVKACSVHQFLSILAEQYVISKPCVTHMQAKCLKRIESRTCFSSSVGYGCSTCSGERSQVFKISTASAECIRWLDRGSWRPFFASLLKKCLLRKPSVVSCLTRKSTAIFASSWALLRRTDPHLTECDLTRGQVSIRSATTPP
jgi:hypothetical protein